MPTIAPKYPKANNPFRFVKDILREKKYILNTEQDEKDYIPFLINRSLSYHIDCILYVEQIASRPTIPNKWAYDYYFHAIRAKYRPFQEWIKKETNDVTEMLMEYYQVNRRRAEEYQQLLNKEQIDLIKEDMEQGGY